MNNNVETNKLKEYIDYVVGMIFISEQSFLLYKSIGLDAGKINSEGAGSAYFYIQEALKNQFILGITKLFEIPHPKYETINIPATINLIDENASRLEIRNHDKIESFMKKVEKSAYWLKDGSDEIKIHALMRSCRESIPKHDDDAIMKLKYVRDKMIAHNQKIDIEVVSLPAWGEMLEAIKYAKEFVTVIGYSFLDTAYRVGKGGKLDSEWGEDFVLTVDAEMNVNGFERILKAGLDKWREHSIR